MKIFVFGNEFLKNDSLAKEIVDELQIEDVEFVKCDSLTDIFDENEIVILDVVDKIEDVILIEDVNELKDNQICSLHDFDLSFFLQLKDRFGDLKKVKIIGIPMKGDKERLKKDVIKRVEEMDENFEEDIIFAKRTEDALKRYEEGRGNFTEKSSEEFLKELEEW
jgi:Ni,Fe-hydrogenase maturation factor